MLPIFKFPYLTNFCTLPVNFNFHITKKDSFFPSSIINIEFNNFFKENYVNSVPIFTDASRNDNPAVVGAAFYAKGHQLSEHIFELNSKIFYFYS
jgi:hypothetical protein